VHLKTPLLDTLGWDLGRFGARLEQSKNGDLKKCFRTSSSASKLAADV